MPTKIQKNTLANNMVSALAKVQTNIPTITQASTPANTRAPQAISQANIRAPLAIPQANSPT